MNSKNITVKHDQDKSPLTSLYARYGKRAFDVTAAAVAVICAAPLLVAIAGILWVKNGRPVVYAGKRVGYKGQTFFIRKFRTMIPDAELQGGSCTTATDPRVTPIGRVLRRTKLDELPQLFNVLEGEMSIVGPRPDMREYIDKLDPEDRAAITSVRPGLTDFATNILFDEEKQLSRVSEPDVFYETTILPKKVTLQRQYVNELSFWTDLKIIGKTMQKMLSFHA